MHVGDDPSGPSDSAVDRGTPIRPSRPSSEDAAHKNPTEPLLASIHVMSHVAGEANTFADWRGGMAGAKAQLNNFATDAGPAAVIIGGDYNSTPDMRQFRDLLTDGYRDAVEQTGAGFAPTFPSNTWYPPLLTIDHVLTRNAAASSIRTIEVPGSDHRALLATIEVPTG